MSYQIGTAVCNLRPFRDYSEKDVVNLFTFSGTPIDLNYQIQATKGTFVILAGSGWRPDIEPVDMIGNFGAFSVNNWVGQRYGANAKVTVAEPLNMTSGTAQFIGVNAAGTTGSGIQYVTNIVNAGGQSTPLGMLLFDVRELDENQLPLKYYPRKAAEMEAVISGQVVPIVTHGTFLYSGIQVSGGVAVQAGANAFLGGGGTIATSGSIVVGRFLGTTGVETSGNTPSIALVRINL